VGLNSVGFGNAQFGQQMAGKAISDAEEVHSYVSDDNKAKPVYRAWCLHQIFVMGRAEKTLFASCI
jgi:hypothetical protein